MGKLDEFAWTQDGHEGEPETQHTDLRIVQRPDGYEVKTLIDPSHNARFDSIEDLIPALESMLHQQRAKVGN